jgi:hypothetical protein
MKMGFNGDTKIFTISDRNGEVKREIFDVDNVNFTIHSNIFIVQTIYKARYFIPCVDNETYYTNAYIHTEYTANRRPNYVGQKGGRNQW